MESEEKFYVPFTTPSREGKSMLRELEDEFYKYLRAMEGPICWGDNYKIGKKGLCNLGVVNVLETDEKWKADVLSDSLKEVKNDMGLDMKVWKIVKAEY